MVTDPIADMLTRIRNANQMRYKEVEVPSSKIKVDNNFMTDIKGLYAIGDGAGITRGLMQASATGVSVARDIAAKL